MTTRSVWYLSLAALASFGQAASVRAQTAPGMPDAQVESNVLQALAADPKLADQTISSTTVYGTVTLSGSVRDETTRSLAERTISRTAGVKKVVDELTLGGTPEATSGVSVERGSGEEALGGQTSDPNAGSNPNLQSDGTIAPPGTRAQSATELNPDGSQAVMPPAPANPNAYPAPQGAPSSDRYPGQGGSSNGNPGYPGAPEYGREPNYQAQAPDGSALPPSAGASPNYGGGAPPSNYPPPNNAPSSPYGRQPAPQAYGQPYGAPQGGVGPYGSPRRYPNQPGGRPVVVPAGTLVHMRTNQGMDSKHTAAGTSFSGIVLSDVYAGGYVAMPRGAQVQGVVTTATVSGALKGRGELALQLTGVTLAGQTYPLVSDMWAHAGGDKTLRTVDSAIGLGVVGAIIGGVAGGGPGAAIGAGVGGAAGIGASAASQGGQIVVPAEAVLDFHLTQPTQLTTLSQAELNRLGAGLPYPDGMRRRYPPPPPPYAYGPGYYAYPRYYRPYPY